MSKHTYRRAFLCCGVFGFLSLIVPLVCAEEPPAVGIGRVIISDIAYRSQEEPGLDDYAKERCKLDLYVPAEAKDYATVVWFHGGGLTAGGKSIPKSLQNQGVIVAAVNYRLSPKAKCPAYIEDSAAAVAWTFANIAKHGGDPRKIFVGGHSAGGYLACMVALDKSYLAKQGIDANRIAGVFSYSGQCLTHYAIREEMGLPKEQGMADRFAPIHQVRKDAPPMILITGDRDLEMPARYEENALLFSMLKAAGDSDVELHELKGKNHGSMADPAHALMLARIRQMLGKQR